MAEKPDIPEIDVTIAEPVPAMDTDAVVEAFGGIRPMAAKLGVAVSTVQGWKTRNHIPDGRWRDIQAAALEHGVDLETGAAASAEASGFAETGTVDEAVTDVSGTSSGDASEKDAPDSESPDNEPTNASGRDGRHSDTPDRPDHDDSDDATQPPPPSSPDSTQSPSGGRLALILGIAAIAAVVTRPAWGPYADPHVARIAANFGISVASGPVLEGNTSRKSEAAEFAASLQAELAALRDRLAEVEARPAVVSEGGATVEMSDALASRLAAIEEQIEAFNKTAVTVQNFQAEADAALAQIRNVSEAMASQGTPELDAVTERLTSLETVLSDVSGNASQAISDIAAMREQMAAQGSSISNLESRPSIEGAAQAGLALAVGDIEIALAAGRPFENALARLENLSNSSGTPAVNEAIAGLQPYAAEGTETLAGLIALFNSTSPAMQTEFATNSGDLFGTLFDGAKSLISIRRKGEAPDAPPVSRAEAALERGDLARAVNILTPERERSTSADAWLTAAEARLAAEEALTQLRAAVAEGLTGTAGTTKNGDAS